MRARLFVLLALLPAMALTNGCGEKIVIPEAVGIPSLSAYVDVTPDELTAEIGDPTDIVEYFGLMMVSEGDSNRIVRVQADGGIDFGLQPPITGLQHPVAMAIDPNAAAQRMYVGETGGAAPSIALVELSRYSFEERFDLTGIVADISSIATDGEWLYVSDPVQQVVHRFELVAPPGFGLIPRGVVCNAEGSAESPQFPYEPRGLALDAEGKLMICDADTTRNWVVRFDPFQTIPVDDPAGLGTSISFDGSTCSNGNPSLAALTLGIAPNCGEAFVSEGPSSVAGGLALPGGVTTDKSGRIYVADTGNGRIQRFEATGKFDLQFGYETGDGEGLIAPTRVASWKADQDRKGNQVNIPGARIFVIDAGPKTVRVFEDLRFSG